jgi:hypothetical protein
MQMDFQTTLNISITPFGAETDEDLQESDMKGYSPESTCLAASACSSN